MEDEDVVGVSVVLDELELELTGVDELAVVDVSVLADELGLVTGAVDVDDEDVVGVSLVLDELELELAGVVELLSVVVFDCGESITGAVECAPSVPESGFSTGAFSLYFSKEIPPPPPPPELHPNKKISIRKILYLINILKFQMASSSSIKFFSAF